MDRRLLDTVQLSWSNGASGELALFSTGATSRELTVDVGGLSYSSRWDPREDGPNWVLDPLPASLEKTIHEALIDAVWAGASRVGAGALLAYEGAIDAYAVRRWSHPEGFALVRVDAKRVEVADLRGTAHIPANRAPSKPESTMRLHLADAAWVLPEARPCKEQEKVGCVERLNDPARRAFFLTDHPWRFVSEE